MKKFTSNSLQIHLFDGCPFIFSHSSYEREVDKWKIILRYYSLNVGEPLEIDTTP